jgi:hypothetical protein
MASHVVDQETTEGGSGTKTRIGENVKFARTGHGIGVNKGTELDLVDRWVSRHLDPEGGCGGPRRVSSCLLGPGVISYGKGGPNRGHPSRRSRSPVPPIRSHLVASEGAVVCMVGLHSQPGRPPHRPNGARGGDPHLARSWRSWGSGILLV